MQVLIKKVYEDSFDIPEYKTPGSSGVDLQAYLQENTRFNGITLERGDSVLIHTGFSFAIPEGFEGQVRSRSGLASKHGIFVLNSPGTIDSDYRGEVCVVLTHFGFFPYTISHGMRIAQFVFTPIVRAELRLTDTLPETLRGEGGFGSTGC